ncbi:MAG TPA: hypothetical protein VKB86_13505 [Pyrinomonadaceae bacterium]|nr:hypothetical protein [Pyrinomonadaceae bacterium]
MTPVIVSIALSLLLCGPNNLPERSFSQPVAATAIQRVTYRTYANARFQYSVSYPAGILIPQGESTNSDGQIFRSRDGHAEMRVFGRYNVQNETLKSAFNAAQEGKDVTYKVMKGNFYVVSGRQNGKVFYEKTMLKGDTFKTFMIEYDESDSAKYDPITARIARSFVG